MVLIEQRRAGRTRLGGAQVPVDDPHVRPVARHRGAEVAGRLRCGVFEADTLLIRIGMVDADGRRGLRPAAVPAGKGDLPGRIGILVQFHECEIGRGIGRPEIRTGLKLAQGTVARAAAGRAAHRPARAVFVVPVHHQGCGIARVHAAVIGRHEIRRQVLRGVVHHEPRAERAAARGNDAHRGNLRPPVVAFRADHVHVARPGPKIVIQARHDFPEAAVADVDRAEFQVHPVDLRGGNGHFHHDVVRQHNRRPQFPVRLVVRVGERPHDLHPVRGIHHQSAAGRHSVSSEPEVE